MTLEHLEARSPAPPARAVDPAVSVRGVSKSFGGRTRGVRSHLLHPEERRRRYAVLRDVSFDVAPAEFLAVVGRNGSGKSTLLRCIAGVYGADAGEIAVRGRIAPFIELGASFHPELTARDNVALVGSLIGLPGAGGQRRYEEIIDYADLGEFEDMQLKHYSSGMQARLAFSIAIQAHAEIQIFDEVIAVGDVDFRRKCFETLRAIRADGRTVIYVSHDLDTVRQLADRVLLLERGRPATLGDPDEVLERYERSRQPGRTAPPAPPSVASPEDRSARRAPAEEGGSARLLEATGALVRTEFKVRYLDSILGYVWALVQPALMFAVLVVVFSRVVRFDDVAHYPVQLLFGVVLFNYFTEGTGLALTSFLARGNLLRRIAFPPLAVPVASVLTTALTGGVALFLATLYAVGSGVFPTVGWLQLLPLLVVLLIVTTSVSMLLAMAYVLVHDIQPTWGVVTRALFFATPVIYPIAVAPEGLRQLIMLNPLSVVVVQAKHALVDPDALTAAEAIGGAGWLAVPALITVGLALAAVVAYRRFDTLVERI